MDYAKIIGEQFDKVTLNKAAFYAVPPEKIRIQAEESAGKFQLWCMVDGRKAEMLTAKKLTAILNPPFFLKAMNLPKMVAGYFLKLLNFYDRENNGEIAIVSHFEEKNRLFLYENGQEKRELPDGELEKILRA